MNARTRGKTSVSLAVCTLMSLGSMGCNPYNFMAAVAAATGGEWVEANYRIGEGPLLILIDDLDGLVTEPRAVKETHETISEIFYDFKINRLVIPLAEWQTLRQTDKKYDSLSVRQIGEKLGAEQVLYIKVVRFTLSDEPGADIYKGHFVVRIKVLSTRPERDVRLWPPETERAGHKVEATTATEPIDGDRSAFEVARELSIRLGQAVAKNFYGYRELED
ncbi:MAG: hypothetical protein O7B26_08690 [Planctomycetota bacterium]|nr:hypothetical protein [Planctomycetota bacterium]